MKEQTLFFNLSEPLEFSKKGEFETTLSLEIAPPSPENYNLVMALGQKLFKGITEMTEREARLKKDSVQSPDDKPLPFPEMPKDEQLKSINAVVLAASVPVGDYVDLLAKLLERTCKLDADTPMRMAHFNKIGIIDKTNLLCEYVVNFIIPSVLSQILGGD